MSRETLSNNDQLAIERFNRASEAMKDATNALCAAQEVHRRAAKEYEDSWRALRKQLEEPTALDLGAEARRLGLLK